ncbi:MAG: (2Fe-2S)-binding protein [Methylobacteriaceae bacterium]|nr:(2Fe-2S)-binding protein [Methylobacteriaceae bacterium]
MSAEVWLRRIRLVSGLVVMAFVACHLTQLALGLFSLATIESYLWLLTFPWETPAAEGLLLTCAIVHAILGLQAIAARRSLAMSTTDVVQAVLALMVVPVLTAHVLLTRIAGDLVRDFVASYRLVLAAYWSFAPIHALQQLLAVMIVWTHAAIGLYSRMVLLPIWSRIGGLVLIVLFGVPVLALLGFVNAGQEALHRLAEDPGWRQGVEADWAKASSVLPQLNRMESWILAIYGAVAVATLAVLMLRLLLTRRHRVRIVYEDGREAEGRSGLSILEISLLNGVPHAHVCSGRGRCGTCRVEVGEEPGQLSPPTEIERATLAAVHAGANVRLACQARVLGRSVHVTRLLPAFADASAAREPEEWAPEIVVPAQELIT